MQLPYKSEMIMRTPDDKMWSGTSLPSMSIGYEMVFLHFRFLLFIIFANKGKMVLPRLVTSIKSEGNIIEKFPVVELEDRIFSEESVNKLLPYMEQVVSNQRENWTKDIINGTAKNIFTDKYKIQEKQVLVKMNIGTGLNKQNMKDHILLPSQDFFLQIILNTLV